MGIILLCDGSVSCIYPDVLLNGYTCNDFILNNAQDWNSESKIWA